MTVLDALLDSPLREAWSESQHKRGAKGTSQGGKFVSTGASGDGVRKIQRKVGAKADGAFGYNTRAAVMAYQRAHGLRVDGIVGHQTAQALLGHKNARNVSVGELTADERKHFADTGNKRAERRAAARKGTAPTRQVKLTAKQRAVKTSRTAGGIVA